MHGTYIKIIKKYMNLEHNKRKKSSRQHKPSEALLPTCNTLKIKENAQSVHLDFQSRTLDV
jgi:hypothetical protein